MAATCSAGSTSCSLAGSHVTRYVQAGAPSAWQASSSTVAGGSPKSSVVWVSSPAVHSQWWRWRVKPGLAKARISA
jgi:hypothetical protein